jgi:putative ABC transport system permease protein
LLFGLAPALHVRGLDITRVLKQEGRGSTGSGAQARARRTLVIAELALSLVLMTAAALLLRSFWNLDNAPLGFDAQGVTIIRTRLPYPNDAKEDLYATAADEAPFIRDVLRRVRALPGVQDAAIGTTSSIPLDHPEQDQNVLHVVFAEHAAEEPSLVTGAIVLPDYFRLLRIPLVRGRLLTALDDEHSPSVAVINEAMARRYWPNENPVGKRLKLSPRSPTWATVVGVVADARTETLKSERVPVIYASVFQRSAKHLAIYLRGKFTPAAITDQVRHEVQSVNAALPVFGATTLAETVSGALTVRRFSMKLIAIFALTALLLAALGIYGVIAYMVSERTHELGVRLALGASASDLMRMILGQGVRLSLTGAAIGVAGALIVSHLMSGLLYGVSPRDPLVFASVSVVLTAVALAACCVPALRAVRVDPIVALRC